MNLTTDELKTIEAEIKTSVATEINPTTNKLAYTNDVSRDAEFVKRKPSDLKYMDCHLRLAKLRNDLSNAKIEAERLGNTFSATKHLADLYAAWMNNQ